MLYIVATPIGNLEDITLRALRVLKEADYIAAEDTRHTRKLLNHYGIKTRCVSFHEHSKDEKRAFLLNELKDGRNIALVSDAGTPLISDPGAALVREAVDTGLLVTSVPGPCAAVTAVTLAGVGGPFCFLGFFSKKSAERKKQIERLKYAEYPSVIYESPHALHETLCALADALGGERHIVVAKELTKLHERIFSGTLTQAAAEFGGDIKGEFVLVLDGAGKTPDKADDGTIQKEIEKYIASGMTKKDAAKAASEKFGIGKNKAYRLTF